MRILQISAYFYPSPRGTETYTCKLSENLLELGQDVDILTINSENVEREEVLWGKSKVYRCSPNLKYSRAELSWEFVKRIMGAKEYDLYHIQIPFHSGLEATIMAAKRNRVPLIATHHGQSCEGALAYRALVKMYDAFFTRLAARHIDRMIIWTQSYSETLPVSRRVRERCRVVRPAVDVERFSPLKDGAGLRAQLGLSSEDRVVLYVSALNKWDRRKGADHAIRAMAELRGGVPEARLVVVGGGELLDELKQLARVLDLEDRVHFAGSVYGDDLPRYYAMCDVFVLPSVHEPFGLTILEAMASGKAVIASDIPGARDNVREGETGLRVPPANPQALAGAIRRLMQDDALRTAMGKCGREEVEGRSWRRVAEDTAAVYREVVPDR